MARRSHDDALGVAGAETVIGTGVIVHGNISSESDIVIDGTLDGSITTSGNVTVGVNAQIQANIRATNVTIAGSVKGNIVASGETSLLETSHVEGDVKSSGLAIASGGVFIGKSLMEAAPRLDHANSQALESGPLKTDLKPRKPNRDHEV
jgi:cytoskeletal protein CcmA (bactofilin family)